MSCGHSTYGNGSLSVSFLSPGAVCLCSRPLGFLLCSGSQSCPGQQHTRSVWVSGLLLLPGLETRLLAPGPVASGTLHPIDCGGGAGVSTGVLRCWPLDCTQLGYGHPEHVCACECVCACASIFGFGSWLLGFGQMRVKKEVGWPMTPVNSDPAEKCGTHDAMFFQFQDHIRVCGKCPVPCRFHDVGCPEMVSPGPPGSPCLLHRVPPS